MAARLRVECYAGYKADERPRRFTLLSSGSDVPPHTLEVTELLDQWYGPGYQCFKVRADDKKLYILRHDFTQESWTLDAFRNAEI